MIDITLTATSNNPNDLFKSVCSHADSTHGEHADTNQENKLYNYLLDEIITCLESIINDYDRGVEKLNEFADRIKAALGNVGITPNEADLTGSVIDIGKELFNKLDTKKDTIADMPDFAVAIANFVAEKVFTQENLDSAIKKFKDIIRSDEFYGIVWGLVNGLHTDDVVQMGTIKMLKKFANKKESCHIEDIDIGVFVKPGNIEYSADKLEIPVNFQIEKFKFVFNKGDVKSKALNKLISCAIGAVGKFKFIQELIKKFATGYVDKVKKKKGISDSLLNIEVNFNNLDKKIEDNKGNLGLEGIDEGIELNDLALGEIGEEIGIEDLG